MEKAKQPTLGSRITTNKKFKPKINSKEFKVEEQLKGIIILESGDGFGIQFEKTHQWANTLNGLLVEKKGFLLARNEFVLKSTEKYSNKNKQKYVEATQNLFYKGLNQIPNDIKYKQENIKGSKMQIERENKNIKSLGKSIETLEKKSLFRPDTKIFEQQFDRLMKAPKIKDIEFYNDYIIVTTNDLIYEKTNRIPKDFNIGAFKIFIPLDANATVRAINYKKQVRKHYYHPCISSEGSICTGQEVKNEIIEYRQKNQLDLLVFLLIGFFEKPDYDEPYIGDVSFMCAQKVTIKPKNILDWINSSYWDDYEIWDGSKFDDERNKLMKSRDSSQRSEAEERRETEIGF